MLPTRLNLLSPEKKLFLRKLVLVQFSRHLLELLLLLVALVCIMFLGGEWVLENYFANINGNHTLAISQQSKVNQEIKALNLKLLQLEVLQKNSTLWSSAVTELVNSIPPGVAINSLQLSKQGNITLSGRARNRETLLLLKENLEKLSFVKQVSLPPSNLTERENIEFSLTIEKK